MTEEQDDLSSNVPGWARVVLVLSLLGGSANGVSFLTKDTSDRYKGADAARDFSKRDSEISELKRRLSIKDRRIISLEDWRRYHTEHSATWTQIIKADDGKLEDLEEDFKDHLRTHEH